MKTKLIILLAATAVITLSFTFASSKKEKKSPEVGTKATTSESSGGFVSEGKI
jgi:uncharacterized secreted protein with C-terminal beta-propeller domain